MRKRLPLAMLQVLRSALVSTPKRTCCQRKANRLNKTSKVSSKPRFPGQSQWPAEHGIIVLTLTFAPAEVLHA